jgi:hypothetical protein
VANLRAAGTERTTDIQAPVSIVYRFARSIVRKLKTSLVDRRRIQYRGFSHLHVLIYVESVLKPRSGNEKPPNPGYQCETIVVVTNYERVVSC